jgi:hypothetical protein
MCFLGLTTLRSRPSFDDISVSRALSVEAKLWHRPSQNLSEEVAKDIPATGQPETPQTGTIRRKAPSIQ